MNPRPPAYEADALPLSYAGRRDRGKGAIIVRALIAGQWAQFKDWTRPTNRAAETVCAPTRPHLPLRGRDRPARAARRRPDPPSPCVARRRARARARLRRTRPLLHWKRDGRPSPFAPQMIGQLVRANRKQVALQRSAAVVIRQAVEKANERLLHDVFAGAAAAEAAFNKGQEPPFVPGNQVGPGFVFAPADAFDQQRIGIARHKKGFSF